MNRGLHYVVCLTLLAYFFLIPSRTFAFAPLDRVRAVRSLAVALAKHEALTKARAERAMKAISSRLEQARIGAQQLTEQEIDSFFSTMSQFRVLYASVRDRLQDGNRTAALVNTKIVQRVLQPLKMATREIDLQLAALLQTIARDRGLLLKRYSARVKRAKARPEAKRFEELGDKIGREAKARSKQHITGEVVVGVEIVMLPSLVVGVMTTSSKAGAYGLTVGIVLSVGLVAKYFLFDRSKGKTHAREHIQRAIGMATAELERVYHREIGVVTRANSAIIREFVHRVSQ